MTGWLRNAPDRSGGWWRLALLLAIRALLASFLWWAVSGGDIRHWWLASGVIATAVVASLLLVPPGRNEVRPLGLLRFAYFFTRHSVLGGVDVAWRAVHPAMPIKPDLVEYRLRLTGDAARVLLMDAVSLLPGTLSVRVNEQALTLHVLDTRMPYPATIEELEQRIAEVFGLDVPAGKSGYTN